ncbi:MAG TPA: UbiA family prenyltransferase [Pirellulales bacterium]|jgi:4-hydroxybenzoate polyprenyltransferase/phosphoglycolate phosphatase-like HAD superfamily hydrolase|nr:UbiA family prenyltransferase [Pirellulales bacterium]
MPGSAKISTEEAAEPASASPRLLFVDLDGTLIRTDLLWESLLATASQQPWRLWTWACVLPRGRAQLKRAIAEHVPTDAARLPFRAELLEFLAREKSQGTRLVLATASDHIWAQSVAAELDLFDAVLASDGQNNLKGAAKLAAIENYCRHCGASEFDYLGDSSADLPIWKRAAGIGVVEPSRRLLKQVQTCGGRVQSFGERPSRWRHAVRALRPQQWIKNILLFVPLVLAHAWHDGDRIVAALLAFVAFSASASATYIVNDLLDVAADRCHPRKCRRPFASGALPLAWGPPLAAGLLLVGFATAIAALPAEFVALLLLYGVLTLLYSCWLKRKVMVDVMVLAGLYTLRVVAGGVAADVPVSEWLMALSLFLFTSLAFGKRYIELSHLEDDAVSSRGRGYQIGDLGLLESVGPTSGYIAVLVLALYIHGDTVKQLYPRPWALWLICPLFLYWVNRFWILAKRRVLSDDPLVFAFKDRVSLALGAISALLMLLAAWPA